MTPVERVARAIDEKIPDCASSEDIRRAARAAIEALLDPTELMIKRGVDAGWGTIEVNYDVAVPTKEMAEGVWSAMISAALAEGE